MREGTNLPARVDGVAKDFCVEKELEQWIKPLCPSSKEDHPPPKSTLALPQLGCLDN